MGNSNGTLAEYWDAIESHARAPGRLHLGVVGPRPRPELPDGTTPLGLRRRLRRQPNDGNFCIDGLVWPDRPPEAGAVGAQASSRRPSGSRRRGRRPVGSARDREPPGAARDLSWLARLGTRSRRTARSSPRATCRCRTSGPASAATVRPGPVAAATTDGARRWLTLVVPDRAEAQPWAPAGFEVAGPRSPLRRARPAAGRRRGATRDRVELDDEGRLVHPLLAAPPALPVARADRQRPDRRHRPTAGRPGVSTGSSDRVDRSSDRTARRRRPQRAADRRRALVVRHEQRLTSARPAAGSASRRRPRSPTSSTDLARVGTVLETVAGLEQAEWFGRGPARDVPRPEARRARSAAGSRRVDGPRRPVHPAAGERRPRRRPLAGAPRATAGRDSALALDRPLQVSATHLRAADLAAATHDVELAPRRRDDRPPRRRPSRARHRELRPRHAAGVPRRTRAPTRGAGRSWPPGAVAREPIEWDADARQFHLTNGHVSYVLGVHENGALGLLHLGRAARRRALVPPPRPAAVRRVLEPRSAIRSRSSSRRRGSGDFRDPGARRRVAGRLDASSSSRYRGHRIAPGKPALAGPAVDLRRGRRRGRDARGRPASTSRPGLVVTPAYTIFRDVPVDRPVRSDSGTTAPAPLTARRPDRDERVARPARCRLGPRPPQRHVGARAPRPRRARLVPGRQSVSSSVRGSSATSTTRSCCSRASRRRPRSTARPSASALVYSGQLPRRGRGRAVRAPPASGSGSTPRRSPGRWSPARRSRRPRPSSPTRPTGSAA